MARGSFPYIIIVGALTLLICGFLWVVLDVAAVSITASPTWGSGGTAATTGQDRIASLWRYSPVFIVTATGMTLILASRRGA